MVVYPDVSKYSSDDIKKEAIRLVLLDMSQYNAPATIIDRLKMIVKEAISLDLSYQSITDKTEQMIKRSSINDSSTVNNFKTDTLDFFKSYNRYYNYIIASDLQYEWFRYSGSDLTSTRIFCQACKKRDWFHISEIPRVLKGDFLEFEEMTGIISKRTMMPKGLKPWTNINNFQILVGGYNCGHQWRPGSEDMVPQIHKDRVYNSEDYKKWFTENVLVKSLSNWSM